MAGGHGADHNSLCLYYKEGSSEPPQQGAGLNNYIISLTWVCLCLPQLVNILASFTIFITSKVGISAQLHSKNSPVVVEYVAPGKYHLQRLVASDRLHQVQCAL